MAPRNFGWVLPGRLAGSALPGSGSDWGGAAVLSDLRDLHESGVRCLVSLNEEAAAFGPLCRKAGLEWIYFPIGNYGLPDDRTAFDRLVARIITTMEAGRPVCLHCWAGIGRTGTVLACVAGRVLGLEAGAALRLVRRNREALETEEQEEFVREYLEEDLESRDRPG